MASSLPTADSLFDPIEVPLPKADDLFGPTYTPKPIGPSATWGKGVGRSGTGGTKDFLANTSLGRIMDAFGQGAKEAWGEAPIGLSDESKLRMMTGDYDPASKEWAKKPFTIGGAYTEAFTQPLAAAVDILFRAPNAAVGAAASGVNQLAAEYSPKWLNRFMGVSPDLSTNVKGNVLSEEEATALNNQLGAVLAMVTLPDPVYSGLKPAPTETMLNRQQSFSKALGDADKTVPNEVPNVTRQVEAPEGTATDMTLGTSTLKVDSDGHLAINYENIAGDKVDLVPQLNEQQSYVMSPDGSMYDLGSFGTMNRLHQENYHDAYLAKIAQDYDNIGQAGQLGADALMGEAISSGKLEIPVSVSVYNNSLSANALSVNKSQLARLKQATKDVGAEGILWKEKEDGSISFVSYANTEELDRLKQQDWSEVSKIAKVLGREPSPKAIDRYVNAANEAKAVLSGNSKYQNSISGGYEDTQITPKLAPDQMPSTSPKEAPTEPLIVPEPGLPVEAQLSPTARLEASKDIEVKDLGEPGSLEAQVLAINPDLVMYNQYGTHTSMVDINNLSEVTGVPVDALMRRESPYSSLDPVQSIKLEKAFRQMADETQELGRKVVDEASAMAYLQSRQKLIQSLSDVERKDYMKGLALKAEQSLSKEEKLKSRAVATFFRDQDFEGAFTPDGKLTPEGLQAIQAEANEVRKINSAEGVNKYLRKKTKDQASGFYTKTRDMTLEYLYNWGMLSSPKTHAANIVSNTLVAMLRTSETGLAGGIGTVRSLFSKADDRVYLGEAYQKAFGLVQGMPEGFKAASKAFILEEPTFGRATKAEINKKATPGLLGAGVRAPGNLMMAEDEFFKAMAYRASVNSQAYREAVKKGLTGQKFANHIAKRVANPTDEMREIAYKEANYDTFTKELGTTGKKIEALGREWPIAKFLTFPFMRTPTNIFKFTMERTPLSLASKEVRSVLKGDKGKAARDEQIAKMVIGSSVMYMAFKWASEGKLTGNGPKDPVERGQWLSENQPNSAMVDGEWYRLDRLGPLGSILSLAADGNYVWDKRGRAATEKLVAGDMPSVEELADMNVLLMVAAGNVINQLPLVNGINDLSDAMNEDDGYKMQKMFINLAQRFAPAIGADINRMNDPYLRDVKTLQDAFNARTPFKSEEIPAMLDSFGQPIPNTMQGLLNVANPVQHKPAVNDPVIQAMKDVGYDMARPNKNIGGVPLTRDQYRDYWQLSGTASKMALHDLITAIPDWETIPPQIRKEMMQNTVKRIREIAATSIKMKSIGTDNDIFKQMYENKMDMFSPTGDE